MKGFKMVLALVAAMAMLLSISAKTASATVTPSTSPLFTHSGYNYGASVIQNGTIRQYWWCGYGTAVDNSQTDVIYYRSYDSSTATYTPIVQVLAPYGSGTAWDSKFICDPSVIQGTFANPDNGLNYSYALYYTATNLSNGSSNSIGLAYSNDGITWLRYSANPVIVPQSLPTTPYGAGQAATYSYNGVAGLRVTYDDQSVTSSSNVFQRSTSDGIHFSAPVPVSGLGTTPDGSTGKWGNPDIAFDYVNQYWYAIWPLPGRAGDRETYRMAVARMSNTAYPSGTWERLGDIDTNSTGDYLNHNPTLVRDKWGNVNITLPSIEIVYAAGTNDPYTWNLKSAIWSPSSSLALKSYNSASGYNDTTTGVAPSGYTLATTLGYLSTVRTTGQTPLYACLYQSYDYFVSLYSNCETQTALGFNGYSSTPPSGTYTVALYRCRGFSHFVSLDPTCGGAHVEDFLGYISATP